MVRGLGGVTTRGTVLHVQCIAVHCSIQMEWVLDPYRQDPPQRGQTFCLPSFFYSPKNSSILRTVS